MVPAEWPGLLNPAQAHLNADGATFVLGTPTAGLVGDSYKVCLDPCMEPLVRAPGLPERAWDRQDTKPGLLHGRAKASSASAEVEGEGRRVGRHGVALGAAAEGDLHRRPWP